MYSYIYIITYVDLYVLSKSVSMLCTHFLLYKINVFDCICDIIYAFINTTHIFACMHDTLDCHSDGRLEQQQTITHVCMYVCLCMYVCMHACMHVCMYVCILYILIVVSWMYLNS